MVHYGRIIKTQSRNRHWANWISCFTPNISTRVFSHSLIPQYKPFFLRRYLRLQVFNLGLCRPKSLELAIFIQQMNFVVNVVCDHYVIQIVGGLTIRSKCLSFVVPVRELEVPNWLSMKKRCLLYTQTWRWPDELNSSPRDSKQTVLKTVLILLKSNLSIILIEILLLSL